MKMGSAPFCQKARLAAVAQQNIDKLLKKKCLNIHTYIHTCIHAESPENGLAGFPKGLQYISIGSQLCLCDVYINIYIKR